MFIFGPWASSERPGGNSDQAKSTVRIIESHADFDLTFPRAARGPTIGGGATAPQSRGALDWKRHTSEHVNLLLSQLDSNISTCCCATASGGARNCRRSSEERHQKSIVNINRALVAESAHHPHPSGPYRNVETTTTTTTRQTTQFLGGFCSRSHSLTLSAVDDAQLSTPCAGQTATRVLNSGRWQQAAASRSQWELVACRRRLLLLIVV